ncbi:type II toxin-antitoxin system death-on-curing family toxin [bacterium]|nr:type II toxin-antitoxin system death-on-curing family toxin [bacterium]
MNYLSLIQVIQLYQEIINQSGGSFGIRDIGALESAIAQPQMTFGGRDLYKTLPDKAAALAFSLSTNHPLVDGNKRISHAAMEIFLIMNGLEIQATVDEQEKVFLELASGKLTREQLSQWIQRNASPKS